MVAGSLGMAAAAAAAAVAPDVDEAATKAAMVRCAREVVVLADSRKIGAESTTRFATLDDIDVLITDEGISEHQLKALKKAGVDVVIV